MVRILFNKKVCFYRGITFALKDLGPLGYFLGIQVTQTAHGLHLRQSKYILDSLHRAPMVGAKPYAAPCVLGSKLSSLSGEPLTEASEYHSVVGALQYCRGSTPLPTVSLANANPESGAYEKKQRAKTSKVWNDFESVVIDVKC